MWEKARGSEPERPAEGASQFLTKRGDCLWRDSPLWTCLGRSNFRPSEFSPGSGGAQDPSPGLSQTMPLGHSPPPTCALEGRQRLWRPSRAPNLLAGPDPGAASSGRSPGLESPGLSGQHRIEPFGKFPNALLRSAHSTKLRCAPLRNSGLRGLHQQNAVSRSTGSTGLPGFHPRGGTPGGPESRLRSAC